MISGLAIKWVDAAGYLASILVFATFCMRTMIAPPRRDREQRLFHWVWPSSPRLSGSATSFSLIAIKHGADAGNVTFDETN